MRRYLHSMGKPQSLHFVYLTSYPVKRQNELKEMNILDLIQNPIIFVMRGPIDMRGVFELLGKGNGIIFDYEKVRLEKTLPIAVNMYHSFVSPGIKKYIKPEFEEIKYKGKPFSCQLSYKSLMVWPSTSPSLRDMLINKTYSNISAKKPCPHHEPAASRKKPNH
ncbi:hypothetical protein HXA31_13790 [Salipaludibacillus agaradhaerens]|uniref:Uncharacterized protein n=1 Tax=Salipaludibacillus agaradhaerens TaxID=76935 RepID=A0A9Q4AZ11_SALAG|nr:hypothetical protein [Salipaludibacillus agaradhaerens]MCR6095006.1 hypothetical protein [Salipaludibacillus agaradhaerens]MCR6115436.1 hypothetical protein [Salipaludibacillus agaradhaerens]